VKRLGTAFLGVVLLGAAGAAPLNMQLVGHWEIVRGHRADRLYGSNVRSFHPGDALNVELFGSGVRIYGITGPTGGHAAVLVSQEPDRMIDFYSATRKPHVLLYQSPPLGVAWHYAAIVVLPDRNAASRGTYVNIDAVQLVSTK
jgi:hypothetical protein